VLVEENAVGVEAETKSMELKCVKINVHFCLEKQ
jgi:hypothetical protein